MPSDAFIGILTGLGNAHRERQKNMFDQEVERREKLAARWEELAEDPNLVPEAKEEYYRKAFGIRTTEPSKKLPKEFENLDLNVEPRMGQSWLGGKTQQNMELKGAPISTSLPGQEPSQAPGAQPQTLTALMPEPPPGTQRSAFYSPQEQSQRKIADAVAMLQALGPVQREQALATRGGESAIDLEEEKAKLAMQPAPLPKVGEFARTQGLYRTDPVTGEVTIVREPELEPETPPQDKEVDTFTDSDGYRVTTYQRPDGSTYERKSTSRVQPPAAPATIRIDNAISSAGGELPREWRNALTRAMPSQANQPTRLARMQEAASYLEAGDTEGLKSRIRQLAIEGESVSTQAQVEGRADAMNAMKDAVGLMEEMKRAGISTNILTGTWEDILRKLGTTSHPKRVEFSSRMQRALSAYTLAMSGVQFSEAEAARYQRLFPNYSNTMPVNETLAKSLLSAMSTEDKRFWEQKLGPDGAKLVGATTGGSTGGNLIVPGGALEKLLQGQGR